MLLFHMHTFRLPAQYSWSHCLATSTLVISLGTASSPCRYPIRLARQLIDVEVNVSIESNVRQIGPYDPWIPNIRSLIEQLQSMTDRRRLSSIELHTTYRMDAVINFHDPDESGVC